MGFYPMASNYPPGTPAPRRQDLRFRCADCEISWSVAGTVELGAWFPHSEDNLDCPNCGKEGIDDE